MSALDTDAMKIFMSLVVVAVGFKVLGFAPMVYIAIATFLLIVINAVFDHLIGAGK